MSSTVVPQIPKTTSSGIDLLMMQYEKDGDRGQRRVWTPKSISIRDEFSEKDLRQGMNNTVRDRMNNNRLLPNIETLMV